MRNKRLASRRRDTIMRLTEEIDFLKDENKSLSSENKKLGRALIELDKQNDKALTEYRKQLEGLHEIEYKVKEHMQEVALQKSEYDHQIKSLLKQLRNNAENNVVICSMCGEEVKVNYYIDKDGKAICSDCLYSMRNEQYDN